MRSPKSSFMLWCRRVPLGRRKCFLGETVVEIKQFEQFEVFKSINNVEIYSEHTQRQGQTGGQYGKLSGRQADRQAGTQSRTHARTRKHIFSLSTSEYML